MLKAGGSIRIGDIFERGISRDAIKENFCVRLLIGTRVSSQGPMRNESGTDREGEEQEGATQGGMGRGGGEMQEEGWFG